MDALQLDGFSVAFGDRVILKDVRLVVPHTGVSIVVGPSGSGKSTLLRTLSGANDGHTAMRATGRITLRGIQYENLSQVPMSLRPGLVRQNLRFLIDTVRENLAAALPNRSSLERVAQDASIVKHLERLGLSELIVSLNRSVSDLDLVTQRLLGLARATLSEPAVLLVDEATAGLVESDAQRVIEQLVRQADERGVLFVTHNQSHARAVGGTTFLLNEGATIESSPTHEFFGNAQSTMVRHFVRTGGCVVPADAAEDPGFASLPTTDAGSTKASAPAINAEPSRRGPRNFFWVISGQLGGLPRPGIFQDLEHDLDGLIRVRVQTLVTLEEWESVPRDQLASRGIEALHFPIVDMRSPTLEAATRMCAELERRLLAGRTVAVHCRAGNGRTGTILAAQLIYRKTPACEALERVRSVNPKAVESSEQVSFLQAFEAHLRRASV